MHHMDNQIQVTKGERQERSDLNFDMHKPQSQHQSTHLTTQPPGVRADAHACGPAWQPCPGVWHSHRAMRGTQPMAVGLGASSPARLTGDGHRGVRRGIRLGWPQELAGLPGLVMGCQAGPAPTT